jgi:hypothetical protein
MSGEVCTRPSCTLHGPMKYNAVLGWWVCHGYDGEGGCLVGMMVTDEQARAMTPLPGVSYERSAAK